MKTLTCAQLGGSCDYAMAAATESEMKQMGWKHASEAHPDRFATTKDMSEEQKAQGDAYFHSIWEAAPENPEG